MNYDWICIAVTIGCFIFRKTFTSLEDIKILMLFINGMAMWASIMLILEKTKKRYRKKLKESGVDYRQSKSYRKMVISSQTISCISIIVIAVALYSFQNSGDYITIITLGLALSDDFWVSLYGCLFRC